jgi:hypothetical protein
LVAGRDRGITPPEKRRAVPWQPSCRATSQQRPKFPIRRENNGKTSNFSPGSGQNIHDYQSLGNTIRIVETGINSASNGN